MSRFINLAEAAAIVGGESAILNLLRRGELQATAGLVTAISWSEMVNVAVIVGERGDVNQEIKPAIWREDCNIDFQRGFMAGYVRSINRIDVVIFSDIYMSRKCIKNLTSDYSGKTASIEGVYLPPFVEIMIEALRHFGIAPDKQSPTKKEIEAFFLEKKLPDGRPITPNLASHMATLIRPPEAMRGGNRRMG